MNQASRETVLCVAILSLWFLFSGSTAANSVIVGVPRRVPEPNSLLIQAGDSVTWVNETDFPAQFVATDEEFHSGAVGPKGQTFSHTFTNTGFFVYEVNYDLPVSQPWFGTIEVLPKTNAQIFINSPIPNYQFSTLVIVPLVASVSLSNQVKQVEFFADGRSVGVVTNFPYRVDWQIFDRGQRAITAVVTDIAGNTWASEPVPILVADVDSVIFPRIMPNQDFVCYYNEGSGRRSSISGTSSVTNLMLGPCSSFIVRYGTYVERGGGAASQRFYRIYRCP